MADKQSYFFCGIGGSGMSSLAQVLLARGHTVYGSDRSYDQGQSPEKFAKLQEMGITLCPQDGSGISSKIDFFIVSSAVEESIPDVQAALKQEIVIKKRAALLAEIFNNSKGIAIGGTSGKSTTTAMLGHILEHLDFSPTVINGAIMLEHGTKGLGNVMLGQSELCVIEADESDGSIALYAPHIAILNNITLDHKPLEELRPLFTDFLSKAAHAVVNLDDTEAAKLAITNDYTVTYAIDNLDADLCADNLIAQKDGILYTVNGIDGSLAVPGRHNVSNALAALAAATVLGAPLADAVQAMRSFQGVQRRLQTIGTAGGITFIDDFAHNGDKIAASLATLKQHPGRLLVMFQPHGFAPTRMMRGELVETFSNGLGKDDELLMPEIYFAGGTTTKDISSNDIIQDVLKNGKKAQFFENRGAVGAYINTTAQTGDRVVIMGARDDTLTDFVKKLMAKHS